jgi:hypothetical protein
VEKCQLEQKDGDFDDVLRDPFSKKPEYSSSGMGGFESLRLAQGLIPKPEERVAKKGNEKRSWRV